MRHTYASRQCGLTLIEFMVSIVIGMLMIAALATLIANQSGTRAEIDKSGRMIENGRYAIQTLANDLQMAGYWGEVSTAPIVDPALNHYPCSVAAADITAAMGLHVQGFDSPATLPAPGLDCVKNHKPGTDVLVVRRVDPDMSDLESAPGVIDPTKAKAGQVYLQTGLSGSDFAQVLQAGDGSTDAATFSLKKKNGTPANLRKVMVHIYYVSKCSVQVGTTCTGGDNGNPIPTLKRVDLSVAAGATAFSPAVTIAEGIENMQIDYGVDTDGNGSPDGVDVSGAGLTFATWPNAVTVKVHLLARSSEVSPGHVDAKSYALGTAGTVTAASDEKGYRRHVFVQSVRLVNPLSRRAL